MVRARINRTTLRICPEKCAFSHPALTRNGYSCNNAGNLRLLVREYVEQRDQPALAASDLRQPAHPRDVRRRGCVGMTTRPIFYYRHARSRRRRPCRLGCISGYAHREGPSDRGEQIDGGGRILPRRLGQACRTRITTRLIDSKVELAASTRPPATRRAPDIRRHATLPQSRFDARELGMSSTHMDAIVGRAKRKSAATSMLGCAEGETSYRQLRKRLCHTWQHRADTGRPCKPLRSMAQP